MTGNLIQAGKGIRIIESEIGPVIPALDIAENIGYTRSAITKAMDRGKKEDKTLFNGLIAYPRIETKHGVQPVLCFSPAGIDRLLGLLEPSPKSKAELCERIEAFRTSALLRSTGKPDPETDKPDPLIAALNRNADIAEILITRYDYDPTVAHSIAMNNVANEVGEAALPWKGPALLPDAEPQEDLRKDLPQCEKCNGSLGTFDPDYDRYFSVRKIAKFTEQSEDRVRNILEKEGLTSWAHGITSLTVLGRQFGKVFITYPEWPHRTYEQKNIRWSPAAVERIRVHLSAGQTHLAAAPG